MESQSQPTEKELNHVFLYRKKTILYRRIPVNTRQQLLEEFSKNPYPSRADYETMTQSINLSLNKIQNWFKYQRKNEFLSKKANLKNYRRKHRFEKNEKKMLEKAFRINNNLDEKTLANLQKEINCNEVHIKRWFYYRNQKLRTALEKRENLLNQSSTKSSESTVHSNNLKNEPQDDCSGSQSKAPNVVASKQPQIFNPQMAFSGQNSFNSFNNYAFLNKMQTLQNYTGMPNMAYNGMGMFGQMPVCNPSLFNQGFYNPMTVMPAVMPASFGFPYKYNNNCFY